MRRILLLTFLLLLAAAARAQQGNVIGLQGSGAPTGSCATGIMTYTRTDGEYYICPAGSWVLAVPAGGGTTLAGATTNDILLKATDTSVTGLTPVTDGDYPSVASGLWAVTTPGLAARTDADGTVLIALTDNVEQVNVTHAVANAITNFTTGLQAAFVTIVCNMGAGTATFTPAAGTVNGAATFSFNTQYSCARLRYDGTNWEASLTVPQASTPPGGSGTELQYRASATSFGGAAGTTWDNTNIDLTWAQGTITTSNPFLNHSATWNGAGVAFEGQTSNITVTAAQDSVEPPSTSTGSDYWNLKFGSTKRWAFQYDASAGFNGALINWNAAGTASVRMFEWATGHAVIRHWGGSNSAASLTIQADAGSAASAGSQAFRIGIVSNGVTNPIGSLGGDTSGSNYVWVNGTTTLRRSCIGGNIGSGCVSAIGHVYFNNSSAGEPFRAVIEAGPTQGTTNLLELYNTGRTVPYSFFSNVGRFHAGGGAVVAGDLALSAEWGSTATDAVTLATSRDQALVYTVTSAGTGQAVNATITWTFGDGTWTSIPVCMIQQSGGTGLALGQPTRSSSSATAYVWIVPGLPVAGSTYEYTMICLGT